MADLITAYLIAGIVSAVTYVALCIRHGSHIYIATIAYLIFGWLPLAVIVLIVWIGTLNENDEI